jgi:phosphoglycerate dehydrogenase-like enzyme
VLPAGQRPWAASAVQEAGGVVVEPGRAEVLLWMAAGAEPGGGPADLTAVLADHPGIGWVQLPWAGVEPFARAGVFDHDHRWTCAKGIYARPVAEHALALLLAGLRDLTRFAQARRWTGQSARTLLGGHVTIFGGGGITTELAGLLAPFGCHITVVRRHPAPVAGAERVVGWDARDSVLAGADADAVVLALALTAETERFFGERQFRAMARHAWLVNVARGRHVVTDDLVAALDEGWIAGAALDVTDPEPLPEGHPLWSRPNCLITPHTANTEAMAEPLLRARIIDNIRRYAAGAPLAGLVDPDLGY